MEEGEDGRTRRRERTRKEEGPKDGGEKRKGRGHSDGQGMGMRSDDAQQPPPATCHQPPTTPPPTIHPLRAERGQSGCGGSCASSSVREADKSTAAWTTSQLNRPTAVTAPTPPTTCTPARLHPTTSNPPPHHSTAQPAQHLQVRHSRGLLSAIPRPCQPPAPSLSFAAQRPPTRSDCLDCLPPLCSTIGCSSVAPLPFLCRC